MKPLNLTEIRKKSRIFLLYFFFLMAVFVLCIYGFYAHADTQNGLIDEKARDYKRIIGKHYQLSPKIDTVYYHLTLLNTDKVENDMFLEKHMSDNKDQIVKLIGQDSVEFAIYRRITDHMNTMLLLKDSINRALDMKERTRKDLLDCMNKSKKLNKELLYDPTRQFNSTK